MNWRERLDGFVNAFSGLGTWRDKSKGGYFEGLEPIDNATLTDLFNSAPLCRKCVATLPNECFREGYDLQGQHSAEARAAATVVGLDSRLRKAKLWGRLYGGALAFFVTDDRQPVWKPLLPGNWTRVLGIDVWDKRRCAVDSWYTDARSPMFGRPQTYRITPMVESSTIALGPIVVHESRLIRFGGQETDDDSRRALAGWDYSVLQAFYETFLQYAAADAATDHLLTEANQAVFWMKGLISGVTSGKSADLQSRLALMGAQRSNVRAVMLDAGSDEKFEQYSTSFAGIPDVVKLKMQAVASAADLPMSLLFSQGPGGLNASDDNELRAFYDRTAAHQKTTLEPQLLRAYALVAPGAGPFHVKWHPLYKLSEPQQAQARLTQAQTDQIYSDMGVLTEVEIMNSRFGPNGYSYETTVDPSKPRPVIAPAPAPRLPGSPLGPSGPPSPGPGPSTPPNGPKVP